MSAPYADASVDLFDAGWSPIPLPPGRKEPPPRDWTGKGAPYPSRADVEAWREEQPTANVAIRLPAGVAALDVDNWNGKTGSATIAAREREWGPLPLAPYVTSRDDGSGIRLFRAPGGLSWRDDLPGVDLIHAGHRYVLVPPSVHPQGRTYRWHGPDGELLDKAPRPDELPELPGRCVAELSKPARTTASADLGDEQVREWLNALPAGPPCRLVTITLGRAVADLRTRNGSRHNAMRADALRLVRWGERGHPGVPGALDELAAAFTASLEGEHGRRAAAEFSRALVGAVQIVVGDPTPDALKGCGCADAFRWEPPPSTSATSWGTNPGDGEPCLADLLAALDYLHLPDPTHVLVALAVAVSVELDDGEPLWVLIVGPPPAGRRRRSGCSTTSPKTGWTS